MERMLFNCGDIHYDPQFTVYYRVKLKRAIGDFPVGTEFYAASVHHTDDTLNLTKDGKTWKFKIVTLIREHENGKGSV